MLIKNKIAILSIVLSGLFAGAFCSAYSTTTYKRIYSDTCVCTDYNTVLGFGVFCEDWNCTGSTTEQLVVNDYATSVYATMTNSITATIATTSTTTWNTNTNYVYGTAIVIFFLVVLTLLLAFKL